MWLVYALLTVGLTSTLAVLMRVMAIKTVHERSFAFTYNAIGLLILCGALAITGLGSWHLDSYMLLLLELSGLGYGLFQRYQFTVRKHMGASELQTIITPTSLIGYLLAVVWLHEPITILRLVGVGLLMLSALMVISKRSKLRFSAYSLLALAIGIGLAITTPLDRRVSPHVGHILTYVAIIWLAQALVTFVPYVSPSSIKRELGLHRWKLPALVCINLLATWTLIAAIRRAPAIQVQPVLASNAVLIVLLGIVFLKERERIFIKISAVLLATIGLVLISH